MVAIPASQALAMHLLRELPLRALSAEADETLRRARVFLLGIRRGDYWAKALLRDYTDSAHHHGVFLFSIVAAERSFQEWREWRALRPPRDPDLPVLVESLSAFQSRWQPRALERASVLMDEELRAEVTHILEEHDKTRSRTLAAKAFVQRVRELEKIDLYSPVWRALVEDGIQTELVTFDSTLADVQDFIRGLPVDDEELADIHAAREDAARLLDKWLEERKEDVGPAFDEIDLEVLGLGELVPPPFDGVSAFALWNPEIAAKA